MLNCGKLNYYYKRRVRVRRISSLLFCWPLRMIAILSVDDDYFYFDDYYVGFGSHNIRSIRYVFRSKLTDFLGFSILFIGLNDFFVLFFLSLIICFGGEIFLLVLNNILVGWFVSLSEIVLLQYVSFKML